MHPTIIITRDGTALTHADEAVRLYMQRRARLMAHVRPQLVTLPCPPWGGETPPVPAAPCADGRVS